MNQKELFHNIVKGERWFNNGQTRNRYVVGTDGMFVYYKRKLELPLTTCVLAIRFAKWAKGTGQLPKQ